MSLFFILVIPGLGLIIVENGFIPARFLDFPDRDGYSRLWPSPLSQRLESPCFIRNVSLPTLLKRCVLTRNTLFLPPWVGVYIYSPGVWKRCLSAWKKQDLTRNVRNVNNLPTP